MILQSQISALNVNGGIVVIVANASQDYEIPKDASITQITSMNCPLARIYTVD
jgi:hypothetical protein